MYKPKNQEKHENQLGGVIVDFAQTRKTEAQARFREFIKGPVGWIRTNQPIRKAVLLEGLDWIRPGIETSHEHQIEKWKKTKKEVF